MSRDPRSKEPFYWFGPGWRAAAPLGIGDLLRDGTIDPGTAALIWGLLERRRSLTVAAGPSGMGKSTLLTALLELLPPATRRIYIRGGYETFAFRNDPAIVPARTALLVNELSPHLPVYLWGPGIERLLGAAAEGYQILATAHADSVVDFVGSLARSPLRIATDQIARFEHVAIMERSSANASGRRVQGVWRLQGTRQGVGVVPLTDVSAQDRSQPEPDARIAWLPPPELQERTRLLIELQEGRRPALPAFEPFPEQSPSRGRP